MASTQTRWQIAGDYFENCNCDVVCPCLFSPNAPLTSQPTAGACEVAFGFHVDRGDYGGVTLDGLNVALIARSPGSFAEGYLSVAIYLVEWAHEQQRKGINVCFHVTVGIPVVVI